MMPGWEGSADEFHRFLSGEEHQFDGNDMNKNMDTTEGRQDRYTGY